MIKTYEENGMIVIELESGAIIKQAITSETGIQSITQNKIEDRLSNIENTLDLILLKQEGLLW